MQRGVDAEKNMAVGVVAGEGDLGGGMQGRLAELPYGNNAGREARIGGLNERRLERVFVDVLMIN